MIANAIYCQDTKGSYYLLVMDKAMFLQAIDFENHSDAIVPRTSLIIECTVPKNSANYREIDVDDDVLFYDEKLPYHNVYLGFFHAPKLKVLDKYKQDVISIINSNLNDDIIVIVRGE